MSALTRSIKLSLILMATTIPALAAEGERDLSGNLAVWIFLGFCALIIVAQLLPLVWHLSGKRSEQAARREPVMEKLPKN